MVRRVICKGHCIKRIELVLRREMTMTTARALDLTVPSEGVLT